MPRRTLRPWFDVASWAQVERPTASDARPWTVLPFNGMRDTLTHVTRELWRQPFERLTIEVPRFQLATTLEPDEPEAVAHLVTAFGADTIWTDDQGQLSIWGNTLHDRSLLVDHMADHHSVSAGTTRRLASLADALQFHAGLHQQVAMYPARRPHWHR